MRIVWLILVLVAGTLSLEASYDFRCDAQVRIEQKYADGRVSFTVISTEDCGTHLQKADNRVLVQPATQPKQGLRKGKTYRLRYRFFAPECMSGKDDCHRESFEFAQ